MRDSLPYDLVITRNLGDKECIIKKQESCTLSPESITYTYINEKELNLSNLDLYKDSIEDNYSEKTKVNLLGKYR